MKSLWNWEALFRIYVKQALNQVFSFFTDIFFEIVARLQNLLVQVLHVISFERDRAIQHSEQDNACAPKISFESFVAFVSDDFWCDVGGCPTLLEHCLPFFDLLTNTKICDFNIAFTV